MTDTDNNDGVETTNPETDAATTNDETNSGDSVLISDGDGGSLLDRADKSGEEDGAAQSEDAAKDAENIDAGVLAARPDYLPKRFWPKDADGGVAAAELLEKVSTAYRDMSAKFQRGEHKVPDAPDGYKLDFGDNADLAQAFDIAGDPGVKAFLELAHDRKWSNEDVNAVLNWSLEHAAATAGPPVDPVAAAKVEIAKLGKGGQALINGLDGWGAALKNQGVLSDGEHAAFRAMARSAEEVRVLAKLRELTGEQSIPMDTAVEKGLPSQEEAYAMTADPKYGADAAYTAKVDHVFEKVFGTHESDTPPANLGVG